MRPNLNSRFHLLATSSMSKASGSQLAIHKAVHVSSMAIATRTRTGSKTAAASDRHMRQSRGSTGTLREREDGACISVAHAYSSKPQKSSLRAQCQRSRRATPGLWRPNKSRVRGLWALDFPLRVQLPNGPPHPRVSSINARRNFARGNQAKVKHLRFSQHHDRNRLRPGAWNLLLTRSPMLRGIACKAHVLDLVIIGEL